MAVPEGDLDGRILGGLGRVAGRDAPGLSAGTIGPPEDGLAGRTRPMGEAQPGPQALCVPVGRWDSLWGADGRGQPMHSGGDGRHG